MIVAGVAGLVTFQAVVGDLSVITVLLAAFVGGLAAALTRWLVSAIDLSGQGSAAWERQARARTRVAMNKYLATLARHAPENAREQERRALEELTLVQLDEYHSIATRQSKMSFYTAQAAMFGGFVLLLVFAVIAFSAPSSTASIVAGALGAASAALAGYIGRTFVHAQDGAASRLRSYFDHPQHTSRYLAAERLLATGNLTDDQRAAALAVLVQGMLVAGEPAATNDGGVQ
ncbi:hypothetical protein AB0J86_29875 [Micromonospora sp. NPDC049559]|uniref:TRADD-N-associated membrane domain-containing protein n=1 Tax=Micromonospora sp. NPDC049559 TaxID=3155923 RepID=UPI00342D5752